MALYFRPLSTINVRKFSTLAQVEVNIDYPGVRRRGRDDDLVARKTSEFEGTAKQPPQYCPTRQQDFTRRYFHCYHRTANVGKSSLLNNLLREDKAIVTDIEGTTRDVIRGVCQYQVVCRSSSSIPRNSGNWTTLLSKLS